MKQQSTTNFLNDLIEVFLHNTIYFLPSEIIFDEVLEQLNKQIEDDFLDELKIIDIHKGFGTFDNDDVTEINQRLLEKRSLLEKNMISLIDRKKQITPLEFKIIIEKYYDHLLFYTYCTHWLCTNLEKYKKEQLSYGIIGAFGLQYEYFNTHLKEIHTYFAAFIDLNKQHDFSTWKVFSEHLPELISRYSQIKKKQTAKKKTKSKKKIKVSKKEIKKQQKDKLPTKKIKQRPSIVDSDIEKMILEGVFKVKIDS